MQEYFPACCLGLRESSVRNKPLKLGWTALWRTMWRKVGNYFKILNSRMNCRWLFINLVRQINSLKKITVLFLWLYQHKKHGTPVLGQESFIKAWRDESGQESAYYSSRGPEFSFQHTHGSSQPLACLVTGVWCCLLTLVYHTHMAYTKSHSVIHMHIKKLH